MIQVNCRLGIACVDTKSSLRGGIGAWISFTSVIPWLDHGI
ncbi:MAG: hypothetical protein ACEY3D_06860 [Rickettsia sp.]